MHNCLRTKVWASLAGEALQASRGQLRANGHNCCPHVRGPAWPSSSTIDIKISMWCGPVWPPDASRLKGSILGQRPELLSPWPWSGMAKQLTNSNQESECSLGQSAWPSASDLEELIAGWRPQLSSQMSTLGLSE